MTLFAAIRGHKPHDKEKNGAMSTMAVLKAVLNGERVAQAAVLGR